MPVPSCFFLPETVGEVSTVKNYQMEKYLRKKRELHIKEEGGTVQRRDYIQTKGGRKAKLPASWQEKGETVREENTFIFRMNEVEVLGLMCLRSSSRPDPFIGGHGTLRHSLIL